MYVLVSLVYATRYVLMLCQLESARKQATRAAASKGPTKQLARPVNVQVEVL